VDSEGILKARDESLARLQGAFGESAETVIADKRYDFISNILDGVLRKPAVEKPTWSDRIDKVVLNRWLGIPIFLLIMWLLFQVVTPQFDDGTSFSIVEPLMNWIDEGFGWLAEQASGIDGWFGALLADGIIGGVGSVIIFLPIILLLFFFLSILEGCGYMARVAFVMDRALRSVGLHGRPAMPMLLGFGCNIPGIMATRTIESRADRMTTILVNPFMSCGARLPIYMLLVPTYFAAHQGTIIFGLYTMGIVVAIAMAWLFRKTLFKGEAAPFVMELPPYRVPRLKEALLHTWERGKWFIIRAGTLIFAIVVVVWALDYHGALEPIGKSFSWLFAPLGFGDWEATVGVITGILAKEAVVGTMGAIFDVGEGVIGGAIAAQLGWNSLAAFSFMTFCLLSVPCVATLGVIQKEMNSWKWMFFAAGFYFAVAWIVSMLIYQIGSLFV
jgi:ferrous iron transport protein B